MFLTFTRTINSISKRSFVSLRQYEHTKVITFVYIYNESFEKVSQLEVPIASLWPNASEFPFRNGIGDEILVFKSVFLCVSRILYARAIEIEEKEIRCYISHNNFHAYRMGNNLPNSTFYMFRSYLLEERIDR